jgi:NAD(P)-dependent dehydrogenase (short-subunit alcohol dehydrogenase family)
MVVRGRARDAITSDASIEAYPGWGAYGVSKAALEHLTRIWAAEVEGTGVRLVTVDPGEMDTVMHAEALPEVDRSALPAPEDAARAILGSIRAIEEVPNGADRSRGAVGAARREREAGNRPAAGEGR